MSTDERGDQPQRPDLATEPPSASDPPFDLVAVGTSAGGLHALQSLLASLPASFPIPIVIVQHLDPRHRSLMSEILERHTDLRVQQASHGQELQPGTVHIAAPARHLLVTPDGTLEESDSELVRFVRPSVDVLFQSVAHAYGDRALAVILTGTGSDGATGVEAIDSRGGTVIVEDEDTAEFGGMPHAARATGAADFVLPLQDIPGALVRLVMPDREPDV